VLLRGAERTVVRRWAPDTRLNGNAFADAELRPGDRLSIGPVELDVLATGAAPSCHVPSRLSAAQTGHNDQDAGSREAGLKELQQSIDRQEQALKQEKGNWQVEREKLQEQAEELDARAARLDREEARFQQQHTRNEIEQAELAAERERFEKEQAEWQRRQEAAERALQQREEAARQAAGLSQESARRQAELAVERERFENEQAEWRSRQEAAEQALQQREEAVRQTAGLSQSVAHEQAELAAAWTRLEKERAEWRDRQEAAGEALREQQEAIRQRQGELDRRATELQHEQQNLQLDRHRLQKQIEEEQSRLERERASLANEHGRRDSEETAQPNPDREDFDGAETSGEPDSGATDESSEESPVDLAEVLRRLGKANLLRTDDEDNDEEPDADPQRRQQPAVTQVPQKAEAGPLPSPARADSPDEALDDDEELSVDEYMSQLMRRVGGSTSQAPSSSRHAPKTAKASGQPAEPDHAQASSPPPRKPVRRKPPGPAPERTGFAAMRELANVSARSAVDQHARRQMVAISRSKLVVAITATVAGMSLLWLWTTHAPIGVTLLAAIVSLAIAVLWALQYAVVTGRLLIGGSGLFRFRRSGTAENTAAVDKDSPADPG
jgi:hypothetical protein